MLLTKHYLKKEFSLIYTKYPSIRKNTGWGITTDGKIACCRINYDDYLNFEIEVLTPDQIKEYKKNDPNNADDSFKKLQVLKKMLDAGLISFQEYAIKKEEIIK
jgi:hypothetical protein